MIAPSLLNANTYHMKEMLDQLEKQGIKYLHVDIADGHFVPLMSFGPNTVKDLSQETSFIMDCHLMVENPENKIETMIAAGADIITVHTEATNHIYRIIQTIHKAGKKAGVAVNPGTPIPSLEEILPLIDLVLIMTTNPGVFGQSFIKPMVKKIQKLKDIRGEKGYHFLIEVDGSINDQTIQMCREAGADLFVSGSYLFSGDMKSKIQSLRTAGIENECKK